MKHLILALALLIPAPIFATEQVYSEMQAYCKASPSGCANRLYMAYAINGEVIAEVARLDKRIRKLKRIINKLRR
jgi:hypothetical protein